MSNSSKLSYGLNFSKKPIQKAGGGLAKRKPIFGGDDSDSDSGAAPAKKTAVEESVIEIGDYDGDSLTNISESVKDKRGKASGPPRQPPSLSSRAKKQGAASTAASAFGGDLSSALISRKHAEAAQELDANIYDYDGVYDSLKLQRTANSRDDDQTGEGAEERRPKYMKSLLAAAAVRKRDALIAEEKKIARDREAEGDEYADKEKFVTDAYRRQQEENRRIEEEERRREEAEAEKNKGGGMTAFYKKMLDQNEQRHAEVMRQTEAAQRDGATSTDKKTQDETTNPSITDDKAKTDVDMAKELNARGATIAINDDGEVVDKRQLLRGGLNIAPSVAKKKTEDEEARRNAASNARAASGGSNGRGFVGAGGKQGMRERQSRMLEAQLAESLKRSREAEEEERAKMERVVKSRKTEADVSSARERYLARKREAEEAKKKT